VSQTPILAVKSSTCVGARRIHPRGTAPRIQRCGRRRSFLEAPRRGVTTIDAGASWCTVEAAWRPRPRPADPDVERGALRLEPLPARSERFTAASQRPARAAFLCAPPGPVFACPEPASWRHARCSLHQEESGEPFV